MPRPGPGANEYDSPIDFSTKVVYVPVNLEQWLEVIQERDGWITCSRFRFRPMPDGTHMLECQTDREGQ